MDVSQQPRARIVSDAAQRAAYLAAFEASGLTKKAFAQREGINYHTFISWVVQRRRAAQVTNARIAPIPTGQVSDTTPGRLEVSLPGKIVVRGDDPATVASLVQSLRGAKTKATQATDSR